MIGPIDQRGAVRLLPPRARIVPIVAVMTGSLLAALPVVADWPMLPPFGFLMLIAWRLLRPELWHAWIGLPLGLFDDLLSGQPIGSAIVTWTTILLALDMMDNRAVWRDYWVDWLTAAAAIMVCLVANAGIVHFTYGEGSVSTVMPQAIVTILLFPVAMRVVALLDRWRLVR